MFKRVINIFSSLQYFPNEQSLKCFGVYSSPPPKKRWDMIEVTKIIFYLKQVNREFFSGSAINIGGQQRVTEYNVSPPHSALIELPAKRCE